MERPAGAEVKPWGWTIPLWSQAYTRPDGSTGILVRGHRAFIKAGGFSSIHLHEQQQNLFFVQSGVLQLRSFIMDGQVPVPVGVAERLSADDRPVTFNEGVPHQFYAETDVECLEIYFAVAGGDACPSDIVRYTENGPRAIKNDVKPYAPKESWVVPQLAGKPYIVPGSVE
jgi:hypothetical protein